MGVFPRIAMLAGVALAVIATTTGVVLVQHRPSGHLPGRATASRITVEAAMLSQAIPLEVNGRVDRWQNDRLVEAEAAQAAAAKAAAAKAAADRAAEAAAAAAQAKAAQAPRSTMGPPATPVPAATIVAYPPGTVKDIITKAFTPLGATAVAWGLRVAGCESGYNPRAYNGAGPYYGLFQFLMSTFRATPFGNRDIYDPVANASAAAWKYSQGGARAWGCA